MVSHRLRETGEAVGLCEKVNIRAASVALSVLAVLNQQNAER